uniref:Uncharacterized protein n=1 Tax=Globisporangium ultimum (strain ATCC 200006 / CBS 805.95 / DAOM BR144) TaxID=431595 RepID=K3WHB3_GLOUD
MDNFLHLVPLENDSDSGPDALVYGDDDAIDAASVALEDPLQSHAAPLFAVDESGGYASEHAQLDEGNGEGDVDDLDLDSLERQRYLKRVRVLEAQMQQAKLEVQQRLDAMKRILELKDPMEQLSEYMALKLDQRSDDDVDIALELLECAQRMADSEDSEIALLGAFFFTCDPPRAKNHGMAAMLPVVAAMMENSSALDHHSF